MLGKDWIDVANQATSKVKNPLLILIKANIKDISQEVPVSTMREETLHVPEPLILSESITMVVVKWTTRTKTRVKELRTTVLTSPKLMLSSRDRTRVLLLQEIDVTK